MSNHALRRALHLAVDLVLDAIEDQRRDDRPPMRRKRARSRVAPTPGSMPKDAKPEEIARVERAMARAGYRRT